jgi:uncharacterized membrane protein
MKKIVEFLKTSLIGGLFVLLPLMLLYLVLAEVLQLVVDWQPPSLSCFRREP